MLPEGAHRVVNDHVASNTYVCATGPGECMVVDPGLSGEAIERTIAEVGPRLTGIFCTHGHFDHLGSAHELRERHAAPVHLHRADLRLARQANFLLMACRIGRRINVPVVDVPVGDSFTTEVGGDPLRFVPVPGHTPGSCLIEWRGALFSGDTIYRDGVGLVDFPGEDKHLLRDSVLANWDAFPDSHLLLPGHGSSGLLGDVKRDNAALRKLIGRDLRAA